MSQPLSPFCVYTIRNTKTLEDVYRHGGSDEFEENKLWKTGRQLFLQAQENDMRMPVIFAPADVGGRLLYYATLSDVEIDAADYTTKYRFTDLTPIDGEYPLSSLKLRSTNRPLSDNSIRPYAICHTPPFISASSGRRRQPPGAPAMFEVGKVYDRRSEIHEPYGGQQQGGISTPRDWPFIFLFTGESGEKYGYRDGWDENGVFLYTGEGQVGDMEFLRGNRAVRDHAKDGKDLHLFENLGKGQGYRYLGRFACSTWEFRRGVDQNGDQRRAIVFHLVHPEDETEFDTSIAPASSSATLDQLRQRALNAASRATEKKDPREAKRLYYERSAAVREYVLARAVGICESCEEPAPFRRPDGTPYLEPHHTRRVSDGGPDHPRWVGSVCPNCHREMHHGANGEEKNRRLQEYLGELESAS